jgi:hypothetical protein
MNTATGMKTLELQIAQLPQVTFAQQEVLENKEDINVRDKDIEKALVLANGYKTKVRIYFKTKYMEEMSVSCTPWAAGDRYITLKGNVTIPIHAITRIAF